jgi:nitrogen fixation/metabolism regulation signal transduction histidine kinase
MSADQEQTAVRQLLSENQRLKQKVFELEEKARTTSEKTPVSASTGQTSVLKLIEHKDFQVQQLSARLEEKKEQLDEANRDLEEKKGELGLWQAAVRLCQALFENDASALIGVSKDGRILLFNQTAPQVLGDKFKDSLHKSIDTVDFRAFDPDTPRKFREALVSGKQTESSIVVRDRRILTTIQPVGKGADSRGALIRIQSLSAK